MNEEKKDQMQNNIEIEDKLADINTQEQEENRNKLEKFYEEIEKEVGELKDQLTRSLAENENLRKRMERQIEEVSKYALTNFAKDLINVAENLERALESSGINKDESNELIRNLFTGVEMTNNELVKIFEKNKIEKLTPEIGSQFDHNLQQAISTEINDEFPANSIIKILQAGYKIHDRVIRPAMVIISKTS